MDNRVLHDTLCDGRKLDVEPDVVGDFRDIPFEDNTFNMVVFDPPHLLKGGIAADLVKQMNYKDDKTSSKKLGYPSWYWNAVKKDPIEWLGASHILGTSEYDQHYKLSKSLYEKFANKTDDK